MAFWTVMMVVTNWVVRLWPPINVILRSSSSVNDPAFVYPSLGTVMEPPTVMMTPTSPSHAARWRANPATSSVTTAHAYSKLTYVTDATIAAIIVTRMRGMRVSRPVCRAQAISGPVRESRIAV
uniref:Secreted protein n=1 Tax=Cacopsylla melanoneura TaxID=428564 RepID=A0A8D8YW07_9HEMI